MSESFIQYTSERIAHWNNIGKSFETDRSLGGGYHKILQTYYRSIIPKNMKVLELGCGEGNLLAALKPGHGVGVDFSSVMIQRAQKRYPHISFIEADAHDFIIEGQFDYIIISDLLNDLWDVQIVLNHLKRYCYPETKIVFNFFSRVWELPLQMARIAKLARPLLQQNWFSMTDVKDILYLTDYEIIKSGSEILFPFKIPMINCVINSFMSKFWPFNLLNFTAVVVARPKPYTVKDPVKVSIVVAARNEEGHILDIIRRTPEMGSHTELIFIEGGSSDNTWWAIERGIEENPDRDIKCARQDGKGKGDAVRKGFAMASGDVLMILDADMTVAPEDLPKFYDAWISGRAEFVNGVRLVYPMEKEAMRFFNLLGNKFFSLAFSWVLDQSIKDTLCGTKVLSRQHYENISENRQFFGNFDPFGDFDLIFGASKLNLKILDLPIRYHSRNYGETNISRWSHGAILLKMLIFAARKLKFRC